ncbi:glycosyl hydrolase family 95 catalytic domain-containing protein [Agromyces intestinalis]|nr:glycoside hydrolase N-terminal domain-containing protein [Agromyces intestinalis]
MPISRHQTDDPAPPVARSRARRWTAAAVALALGTGGFVAVSTPATAAEPSPFGEQPALKAWYSAPAGPANDKAAAWEKESIPLGNGFLGASILGGVDSDEIIINDHTYWTGGPGQNPAYDGGFSSKTSEENAAIVAKAQELLQAAWDGTSPATVDANGNITPATTPSSAKMNEITSTVNQLIGSKQNFGSYRQLSSILMSADPIVALTGFSANYTNPNNPNEGTAALFDGATNTKMFADKFGRPTAERPYEVQWSYSSAFAASGYRLATGNDSPPRDFLSWDLYARADGGDWVLVDTVANAAFGAARQTYKSFDLDVPGSYDEYRMDVTATVGGADPQMSEIEVTAAASGAPEFIGSTASREHPNNAQERSPALFDGDTGTKMYADGAGQITEANPYTVEWSYSKPFDVATYRLATGNDVPGRDFRAWKLYAKSGAGEWTLIDTVADAAFGDARKAYQQFEADVPGSYDAFRMTVTALKQLSQQPQMSEIDMGVPSSGEEEEPVTDYRRELDLDGSKASVSYTRDGVGFQREYFVSNPDDVMAIRLSASEPGRITQSFSLKPIDPRSIVVQGDTITATGWVAGHNQGGDDVNAFNDALHYAQQLKVIPVGEGAELIANDTAITVMNADSVVLLTTSNTNYQEDITADEPYPGENPLNNYFDGQDPLPEVEERIAAASTQSFDELYATHLADYRALYDRVKLNLGNVAAVTAKTTPQLLAGYRDGTNSADENRYLETLYYQFGRYLLISSSREGALPANLQGIWAYGTNPPWAADYHANINLQMNYWLAEQTNLSELTEPLISYIDALVPRGAQGAERVFGAGTRGWTTWHENNIWGNTAPAVSGAFYSPEDGAWLAQHVWEHYLYTQDVDFLAQHYDLLRDAALFWVDTLVLDTTSNKLVVSPSYSPEHGPYSLGATEPQSVVSGLFEDVIEAHDVLGDRLDSVDSTNGLEGRAAEDAYLNEIATAKAGMLGLQIAPKGTYTQGGRTYQGGQLQEWQHPIAIDFTGDGSHRHTNHLYALHPGDQVVAGRSAEEDALVDAMKVTLNTRGDSSTGWSMAWKLNFWARVRDGDRAHVLYGNLLKQGTYDNLWDAHPPFQIDGNFGGTAGATEMLLQSQGDAIELLPATPEIWGTGSVTGLRARGNVGVDIAWTGGVVSEAVLTPAVSQTLTVKAADLAGKVVTDSNGRRVRFESVANYEGEQDSTTIRFDGTAGETYRIAVLDDSTPPTVTVKPESKGKDGVYREASFKLFDEGWIDRLTLNGVEKDLTDNTWSDLNGVKPGAFGGKAGSNKLQVFDTAGNVTTVTFVLDVTGPTVTVKDDAGSTTGSAADGYERVSFKLFDAYQVDRLTLNGVEKDLTDNTWSDLNGVKPGAFGAKLGANELQVFDVAGNATTVAFTLVAPAPPVPAWDSGTVYLLGDEVSYGGAVYLAQWWTRNERPGSSATGSWMERGAPVAAAGVGVLSWTPSWVYTGGERVAHGGHVWKAKWWTRNQAPGDPNGPWLDLGAY